MKKDEEKALKALLSERQKWTHFFEILRRPYIWIPLLILLVYLKESPPIHIPIVDQLIKIITFKAGVR